MSSTYPWTQADRTPELDTEANAIGEAAAELAALNQQIDALLAAAGTTFTPKQRQMFIEHLNHYPNDINDVGRIMLPGEEMWEALNCQPGDILYYSDGIYVHIFPE